MTSTKSKLMRSNAESRRVSISGEKSDVASVGIVPLIFRPSKRTVAGESAVGFAI